MAAPMTSGTIEDIAKLTEAAYGHASSLLARAGRIADYLGGPVPRGVDKAENAESGPGGMLPMLSSRLQRLHDVLSSLATEVGRIEHSASLVDGERNQTIIVAGGGGGGGGGFADTRGGNEAFFGAGLRSRDARG